MSDNPLLGAAIFFSQIMMCKYLFCRVEKSDVNIKEIVQKEFFKTARRRFSLLCGRSPELDRLEVNLFQHQVAGHTKEVIGKFNDKILKPMLKEDLFTREILLYEIIANSKEEFAKELKKFIPDYFGAIMVDNIPYLVLEDLTCMYRYPCVMDLKIGKYTYEPNAPNYKKVRSQEKNIYQEILGFRIAGFKTYDVENYNYRNATKAFGRSLTPSNIALGLASFFYDGYCTRFDVVIIVIEKLKELLRWVSSQTVYHFYCTSLLIVYDGYKCSSIDRTSHALIATQNFTSTSENKFCKVDIKMIDFAHTIASDGTNDVGYIYGISSLIHYLELLLSDVAKDKLFIDELKIMRNINLLSN
jgi:hypothetical protein